MKKIKLSPYVKILLTFIAVILIGAIFLVMPFSTVNKNLSFIDSLFMCTSAFCVTGLSVVNNIAVEFTFFGELILLILMMFGGLGFLTFSTFFFVIIGSKIDITNRYLMKESLNMNSAKGIIRLVKNIVLFALIFQLFGTIINYFILLKYFGPIKSIWVALFQSVSAYNNVGFDILGYSTSMYNYSGNVLLNLSTMFLIIFGGLGFVTIFDVFKNRKWRALNTTTKIVLIITPVLILFGAIFIKVSMYSNVTWLQSFFQSVALRTAGFSTIDVNEVNTSVYVVMLCLMFIGGSPCSTAGGFKTTSFIVLLISMFKLSIGKQPTIFKRKISNETIIKTFSLFALSIIYILFATFLVSIFDSGFGIREILFEVISAFGTVGYSLGITSSLSLGSKIIIIITMVFGRLGILSVLNTMNKHWLQGGDVETVDYVEEKIIVG